MSSLSLVVVLSVLGLLRGCTACKCIALADESKICFSDFVISGTFLETNSVPGQNPQENMIDYRVSVGTVFRSSREIPTTMTISTEGHTCGFTDIQINSTYFIAGYTRDGMYEINRCSSVVAKYGPDNIPYRDSNVKVSVNVTCPEEKEKGDANDGNSAVISTSNVGLLATFFLCAAILKMF